MNVPMWTHDEFFEMKEMRDAAWRRIKELENASLEPLLQASNDLIKVRKEKKELEQQVHDLKDQCANLRARLNFDLPALLRKQV
jgi:hypothetical protein